MVFQKKISRVTGKHILWLLASADTVERFLYSSTQTTSLYKKLTAYYAGLHLLTATGGAVCHDLRVVWLGPTSQDLLRS